ncbi:hypothetical protein H0H93_009218 [Arthromyces matolae]|nr:hypothetical protein H0H93_009218 [Arthromyces matolae]
MQSKKTRLNHNVAEGPERFLSLEASVDDDIEEGDEDEEGEDDFIEDDDPVVADRVASHHLLQIEQSRAAGGEEWEGLLARARSRATQASESSSRHSYVDSQIPFIEEGHLWRIATKPGYEETAAFVLMEKIFRCPSRDWGVQSIVGHVTQPGWILVEANKLSDVQNLCRDVFNVFWQRYECVEPKDGPFFLRGPKVFKPRCPSWLRLTRSPYRGDLALVKTIKDSGLEVLVVPRLQLPTLETFAGQKRKRVEAPSKKKGSPDPSLFDIHKMSAISGASSIRQIGVNEYLFKKKRFIDGLLCLEVTDEFRPEVAIPIPSEFDYFRASRFISPEFGEQTTEIMAVFRLSIGDQVKVVKGDAKGAVGTITDVSHHHASVQLSRESITLQVSLEYVRKHVEIGDEVSVVMGEHKGSSGWVTACHDHERNISVYDHTAAQQFEVPLSFVNFYIAPGFIPNIQSVVSAISHNHDQPPEEDQFTLENDPNRHLIGQHVRIIGRQRRKNYIGTIKSTLQHNFVQVEIAATLKLERLHLTTLALLDDPRIRPLFSDKGTAEEESLSSTDAQDQVLPESSLSEMALVPSTPRSIPDALLASRPWMEHPSFIDRRVKVVIRDTKPLLQDPGWKSGQFENRAVLWVGTSGTSAKVRMGTQVLEVPPKYVFPVLPSAKGQKVIIMDSELIGKTGVVVVVDDICSFRPSDGGTKVLYAAQLEHPPVVYGIDPYEKNQHQEAYNSLEQPNDDE